MVGVLSSKGSMMMVNPAGAGDSPGAGGNRAHSPGPHPHGEKDQPPAAQALQPRHQSPKYNTARPLLPRTGACANVHAGPWAESTQGSRLSLSQGRKGPPCAEASSLDLSVQAAGRPSLCLPTPSPAQRQPLPPQPPLSPPRGAPGPPSVPTPAARRAHETPSRSHLPAAAKPLRAPPQHTLPGSRAIRGALPSWRHLLAHGSPA